MTKAETCKDCLHSKDNQYHGQIQPYCELEILEYPRIGSICEHYEQGDDDETVYES